MDCRKIQDHLVDYSEHNLSGFENDTIEEHLQSCEACQKELSQIKALLTDFSEVSIDQPSSNLRLNFEKALVKEKELSNNTIITLNSNNGWKSYLKIAASIALLISAFLFGKYQQTSKHTVEVAELKNESLNMKETAVLALMENKSASKRIKGVQFTEEFLEPDSAIVSALVDRMLNDENINVRLTAVNTLERFISSEDVKNGYIKALETEKDPAIQITIIQLLVKIQEKKALRPMQELLEQEETQPFIKEEIRSILLNTI